MPSIAVSLPRQERGRSGDPSMPGISNILSMSVPPDTAGSIKGNPYVARRSTPCWPLGSLDEINRPYLMTASARGLGQRACIFGHALKNAAVPNLLLVAATVFIIAILQAVVVSISDDQALPLTVPGQTLSLSAR